MLRFQKMGIFFVPFIGNFLLEIGKNILFAIGNMTHYGLPKWAKKTLANNMNQDQTAPKEQSDQGS